MSRQYDAKQAALKAYPENRKAGVELFLDFLDMSEHDFTYDECCTPIDYIYGAKTSEVLSDDQ